VACEGKRKKVREHYLAFSGGCGGEAKYGSDIVQQTEKITTVHL